MRKFGVLLHILIIIPRFTPMTLAGLIIQARKDRGLLQKHVAKRLNMDINKYSRIERCAGGIRLDDLEALFDILKLDLDLYRKKDVYTRRHQNFKIFKNGTKQ